MTNNTYRKQIDQLLQDLNTHAENDYASIFQHNRKMNIITYHKKANYYHVVININDLMYLLANELDIRYIKYENDDNIMCEKHVFKNLTDVFTYVAHMCNIITQIINNNTKNMQQVYATFLQLEQEYKNNSCQQNVDRYISLVETYPIFPL